jgi:hypothetical protein
VGRWAEWVGHTSTQEVVSTQSPNAHNATHTCPMTQSMAFRVCSYHALCLLSQQHHELPPLPLGVPLRVPLLMLHPSTLLLIPPLTYIHINIIITIADTHRDRPFAIHYTYPPAHRM